MSYGCTTIALITARGGSTRIPRKNLEIVDGLPMVCWSVIQAKCSKKIDEVFLTTDDDEIEYVANAFGAKVIRRPRYENSISANVPFLHALSYIENDLQYKVKNIVPLLPTSFIKKPDDLDNLVQYFEDMQVLDFVNTACPLKECYTYKNITPYQERYGNKECTVPGKQEDKKGYLAKLAITDSLWNYSKMMGGWSIGTRDYFFKSWSSSPARDIDIVTKPMDTESVFDLFRVEEWQCVDIDYPTDLEIAKVLFEHFITKKRGPNVYYEYMTKKASEPKTEIDDEKKLLSKTLKEYGGNFNMEESK